MSWLVVHSKPREESRAAAHLQRQGYNVFLPRLKQRKRRTGGWQTVICALFPRYLFVEVALQEQSISPIYSTQGVNGLIRFGHTLAEVPPDVIAYLQSRQHSGSGEFAEEHDNLLRPGDRVLILNGPFAGLTGVFDINKDAGRVALLVDLLGRHNRILIERDAISAAL